MVKEFAFWAKNGVLRMNVYKEYQRSKNVDSLSREEIDSINIQKRFNLLVTVLEHSRFYKNFYKGITVSEKTIKDPAFWEDLPILEKHHIRERRDELFCSNVDSKYLKMITTGGSTGLPLVSYRDKRFNEEVLQWRMLKRWDLSPAGNRLLLWRDTGEYSSNLAKIKNKLIWFPTRRIRSDVSILTDSKMFSLFQESNKIGVELIWGYVGAIFQYAKYLINNDLAYDKPITCVWVTAAPISRNQRYTIEQAFGAKVLDQYGCSEVHFIASGVRNNDNLVVEKDYRHIDLTRKDGRFIDEDEHDVTGDILITDLENLAFPLIKYRVGDRTSYANQRYGNMLGMPMVNAVKGRISEGLRLKNGSVLSGEYLTTVFDNYVGVIDAFQFVQMKHDLIHINVVSNSDNLDRVMAEVVDNLNKVSQFQVGFRWYLVDDIEHDRGKIRYVKSMLVDEN